VGYAMGYQRAGGQRMTVQCLVKDCTTAESTICF